MNSVNKNNYIKTNYVFMFKTKFIRNFIFFYSVFLITNQFSLYNQKNNPEFNINIKNKYLMYLNNDSNNFF